MRSYRVGDVLYGCVMDCDTRRPRYSEWVVRTIRGGKCFAVLRNGFTWVRVRKGKDQTRKWADAIPTYCRRSTRVGVPFDTLFRTKVAALGYARAGLAAMDRRHNVGGVRA